MEPEDPTTTELRVAQARRAVREAQEARSAARDGASDPEVHTHERRSDKAAYLRDRLAEAESAERAAGG